MPSIRSQRLFQQAIEHAPGEGAVRAAALQRKIDQDRIMIRLGRGIGLKGSIGHLTSPIKASFEQWKVATGL